jgi:hypothetical protein
MLQRIWIWLVGNVVTYRGEKSFDLEQLLGRARKIKVFAESVGNSGRTLLEITGKYSHLP